MDDYKKVAQSSQENRINQEVALVNANPEWVGMGIDQLFIVDVSVFRGPAFIKERMVVGGETEKLGRVTELEVQGKVDEALEIARKREEGKMSQLSAYLEKFTSLRHTRINPEGALSPIAPSMAIESNGSDFSVSIDPHFVEQMKLITGKCPDTTLVVPFYDHRRGREEASNVPLAGEQTQRYIAICDELITRFGNIIQLEIGNETNVTRSTNVETFGDLQFATTSDPHEYARFYGEVARALKDKHPSIKLSLAGLACWDEQYLATVLEDIKLFEQRGGTSKLVDTVSFHPYRENPEEGTTEIANGRFTGTRRTYQEQLIEFIQLARNYAEAINVTVGEINFKFDDPKAISKLQKANEITQSSGVVSIIYPGIHVKH